MKELKDYVKVPKFSFSIESGYRWGYGMDDDASEKFHAEMNMLFREAGWTIEESHIRCACPDAAKGHSRLYLHPQSFDGPCEYEHKDEVVEIIHRATTALLNNVRELDGYTLVDDQEDEVHLYHLEHDGIMADVIQHYTETKRCNLYKSLSNVMSKVRSVINIRTNLCDGVYFSDDAGYTYIKEWIDKLEAAGWLVIHDGYVRWASKKEMKNLKRITNY